MHTLKPLCIPYILIFCFQVMIWCIICWRKIILLAKCDVQTFRQHQCKKCQISFLESYPVPMFVYYGWHQWAHIPRKFKPMHLKTILFHWKLFISFITSAILFISECDTAISPAHKCIGCVNIFTCQIKTICKDFFSHILYLCSSIMDDTSGRTFRGNLNQCILKQFYSIENYSSAS